MDKGEGDGRGDTASALPPLETLPAPRADKSFTIPPEPETAVEDEGVPPLSRRLLGVLLAPIATFRALEPSWGWGGPWLAIAGTGVLAGAIRQARTDFAGAMLVKQQHKLDLMSDSNRRALELVPQESRDLGARTEVFFARMADFLGPTVGAILAIVVVGGLLFAAAHFLGGKRDFLGSVVVAAHAKLVAIVGYAVFALAALAGNPLPETSLSHVANEVLHPVVAAVLGGVDPIALWHSLLLAIGLSCSLDVKPRRALGVVLGLHGTLWLVSIAKAAVVASATGGR